MAENFIGLIPAAGKGVRLGLPYPKELYPVIRNNHYKPISQFVVDNLTNAGLQHIVFVVNETKHQLMGYFGSGQRFGCNISYVVQEVVEERPSRLLQVWPTLWTLPIISRAGRRCSLAWRIHLCSLRISSREPTNPPRHLMM